MVKKDHTKIELMEIPVWETEKVLERKPFIVPLLGTQGLAALGLFSSFLFPTF